MKKVVFLVAAILLVSLVVVVGCTQPAAPGAPGAPVTTTATKTTTSTVTAPAKTVTTTKTVTAAVSAPAPAMEPQKWSFLICVSSISRFQDIELQRGMDRVKERTNGLLDIKVLPLGVLPVRMDEGLRALDEGVIQMMYTSNWQTGDIPLYAILDTPFLFLTQLEKFRVYHAIMPLFNREILRRGFDAQIVGYTPHTEIGIIFKEPVDDLMDLKGKKVRVYAKPIGQFVEAIGGTPVTIAWAEAYTALEQGVIDGLITAWDSLRGAGMHTIAPYAYRIRIQASPYQITVQKSAWEALPEDVRNILKEELHFQEKQNLAYMPQIVADEKVKMFATGLKSFEETMPEGFFEYLNESVTKPLIAEELEKLGPEGEELLSILEETLERKLR